MKTMKLLFLFLLGALSMQAQESEEGYFEGTVINQDGQPIQGANVCIYRPNYETGVNDVEYYATTDADGHYSIRVEEVNDIYYQFSIKAEGFPSYLQEYPFSLRKNFHGGYPAPQEVIALWNRLDYKKDQKATIILPEVPDPSLGRYYRMDHLDGFTVVFEREFEPKANVPYVIFPNSDFSIDLTQYDLDNLPEPGFIPFFADSDEPSGIYGTYTNTDLFGRRFCLLDETSDCGLDGDVRRVGAFRAYLVGSYHYTSDFGTDENLFDSVDYYPFLKEGKTWNVVSLRPVDSAETDTTDYYDILGRKGRVNQRISYVIDGDTVIGGVTYKKLLSNGYFAGGLREEDGRVYGCGWSQTQSSDEKLLYDFNAQIGDVFMNGNGSEKLQVNHVLKVDVNGQSRRCLEMYHYYVGNGVEYYSGGKDYWIEGVGCTGSLIDPFWWGTLSSAYPLLLSCYEDGECIYTCEDFNNQINSMPDIAYRPFIEEGKVWKVGTIPSSLDSPVQIVDCYYLDGDTIIDGKTYKQMMRQRYISPDYPDYDYLSQQPSLSKVGAWYEEDQKVYFYDEDHQVVQLKYDFSLGANEKLDFLNGKFVIGPRQTGLEGFKGVYRDILMYGDEGDNPFYTTWLEGVGGIDGPTRNAYPEDADSVPEFLMSCSVGDEVIYLNDKYEDGASLDVAGARKDRFDFTHTVKVEPKTPRRRSQGQEPLYGEYNNLQLDIHLDLLDDAYLVCITDESGKAVYQKAVNAGNIVGLNIDISAYAKGRYTVTVENSLETFTGEFEVQTTGVTEVIYNKVKASNTIFNLQGQRISSLQKGLNIVNGRKVVIK